MLTFFQDIREQYEAKAAHVLFSDKALNKEQLVG